jgi:CheY-like chemotaxis protein
MTLMVEWKAAGTALVITKDAQTRRLVTESLRPLAIQAQVCADPVLAFGLLNKHKFEAVVVDLLCGADALLFMEQLRFSRTNRTAVSFAISTGNASGTTAARPESTFVLERPLTAAAINQTFKAAYGLIVRERRRYFRCPMSVPALIRSQGVEELSCQTVNVSEGGIAVNAPCTLGLFFPAAVRFSLPGRDGQLFADATVCWSGEDGLVGLEFRGLPPSQMSELQDWLARRLDESLPRSVVTLFRNVD